MQIAKFLRPVPLHQTSTLADAFRGNDASCLPSILLLHENDNAGFVGSTQQILRIVPYGFIRTTTSTSIVLLAETTEDSVPERQTFSSTVLRPRSLAPLYLQSLPTRGIKKLANVNILKVARKILKGNPERSILSIHITQLAHHSSIPSRTLVAPITLPLDSTPWTEYQSSSFQPPLLIFRPFTHLLAKAHQSERVNLLDIENRVRMSLNNAQLGGVGLVIRSSR